MEAFSLFWVAPSMLYLSYKASKHIKAYVVGSRGVRAGDITENDLRREQKKTRKKKRGAY